MSPRVALTVDVTSRVTVGRMGRVVGVRLYVWYCIVELVGVEVGVELPHLLSGSDTPARV